MEQGLMSHSTENKSFWGLSFQPISWLGTEKTTPNKQLGTQDQRNLN